jgi:hypothetical protein
VATIKNAPKDRPQQMDGSPTTRLKLEKHIESAWMRNGYLLFYCYGCCRRD